LEKEFQSWSAFFVLNRSSRQSKRKLNVRAQFDESYFSQLRKRACAATAIRLEWAGVVSPRLSRRDTL
jgi:hypothetical protein